MFRRGEKLYCDMMGYFVSFPVFVLLYRACSYKQGSHATEFGKKKKSLEPLLQDLFLLAFNFRLKIYSLKWLVLKKESF